MIRLGLIGVGNMGQCAHLRNYVMLPDCRVVAIADPHISKARRVAERYGIQKVYSWWSELIQSEKVDGLVVIQPFERHGQILPELLSLSVPILTEKPLAASLLIGEQLAELATKFHVPYMVGYHKRSDPATIWVKKEMIRLQTTEELGKLNYIRITMPPGDWVQNGFQDLLHGETQDLPDPHSFSYDPIDKRIEPWWEEYKAFVNYYVHQINLLRYLMGEDYQVEYVDKEGKLIVARSKGGIVGTIEIAPYSTSRDWQEEVLISFQYGWIKLQLPAPLVRNRAGRISYFKDNPKVGEPVWMSPVLPSVDAMYQQAVHFVAVIQGKMDPPCHAQEALKDLRTCYEVVLLRHGINPQEVLTNW